MGGGGRGEDEPPPLFIDVCAEAAKIINSFFMFSRLGSVVNLLPKTSEDVVAHQEIFPSTSVAFVKV